MYNNESYEEYIRSILGYPNYNYNHFENNNYYPNNYRNIERNNELESCYPEIYNIVYPMITKACLNNTKPVTAQLIDELTEEIYQAVEPQNEIKVNINLSNQNLANNNRSTPNNSAKKEPVKENREENRQFRNNNLSDLIRILLIRELLGNRPQRPGRPPFTRPLFPGGPGGPGMGPRPPMIPRYD